MKTLAVTILLVGILIAGSVVYASTRTTDVKIERAKPTPCGFNGGCGF